MAHTLVLYSRRIVQSGVIFNIVDYYIKTGVGHISTIVALVLISNEDFNFLLWYFIRKIAKNAGDY